MCVYMCISFFIYIYICIYIIIYFFYNYIYMHIYIYIYIQYTIIYFLYMYIIIHLSLHIYISIYISIYPLYMHLRQNEAHPLYRRRHAAYTPPPPIWSSAGCNLFSKLGLLNYQRMCLGQILEMFGKLLPILTEVGALVRVRVRGCVGGCMGVWLGERVDVCGHWWVGAWVVG